MPQNFLIKNFIRICHIPVISLLKYVGRCYYLAHMLLLTYM